MHKLNVEQGSIEWHEARFGVVTGTRLQSAVGAKWDARSKSWKFGDEKIQKSLLYELVSERMSANEIEELNTKAVLRGKELEPFAIKAASQYREIEFIECGMLVSDTFDSFAISPDGIYEIDGVVVGGIETKCPSGKKHIEYLLNDEVPRDYWFQVIAPLVLSDDVQWWDFASYDDRNYERELFITRVERSSIEGQIAEARHHLDIFLKKVNETHLGLVF